LWGTLLFVDKDAFLPFIREYSEEIKSNSIRYNDFIVHDSYVTTFRWLNKLTITPVAGAPRRHESDVELSPKYIVVAVIMMCLMLLGLYYLYDYLGRVIIFHVEMACFCRLSACFNCAPHS